MNINSRYSVIKNLQITLPRGAPFDLEKLASLDISAQLAAKYVDSGWLVRLGQGVYAFPNDSFEISGALLFMQQHVPGLHVAGRSALALQGVRHNLGPRPVWVLWGDARWSVPQWFTSRFPARYVNARLFNWPDSSLPGRTLHTPPGQAQDLCVAVPERAVLELLYEAGTRESLEEARNLFDGLRAPRKELLGQLLSCCTSVKTVRLFLTWARETQIIDVDALLEQFTLPTGSSRRWMSRLDDGTLLSLKPYG